MVFERPERRRVRRLERVTGEWSTTYEGSHYGDCRRGKRKREGREGRNCYFCASCKERVGGAASQGGSRNADQWNEENPLPHSTRPRPRPQLTSSPCSSSPVKNVNETGSRDLSLFRQVKMDHLAWPLSPAYGFKLELHHLSVADSRGS